MADEEKVVSEDEAQVDQQSDESADSADSNAVDPEAIAEEASAEGASEDGGEKVVNPEDVPESDAEAEMLAMLDGLPEESSGATPEDIEFGGTSVSNAESQHLSQPSGEIDTHNIELLRDVNLQVSIELGRTRMSISDILGLGPGSVVELNKLAGEPVDVMVNHKIVARGEVVVIDENFGVRITQLMTAEERLKILGEEQ